MFKISSAFQTPDSELNMFFEETVHSDREQLLKRGIPLLLTSVGDPRVEDEGWKMQAERILRVFGCITRSFSDVSLGSKQTCHHLSKAKSRFFS